MGNITNNEPSMVPDREMEIDHMAFAVRDLEQAIKWYTEVLGFKLKERRETDGATGGMLSAVVKAGTATFVLLQGADSDSQISRFVEKCGPGLHHIAFKVSHIEDLIYQYKASGLDFDTPVVGGPELKQAFAHRDDVANLKLEFLERHVEGFDNGNMSELLRSTEKRGAF